MATLNAGNLTLQDLTSRMDPSGRVSPIVELLSKRNVVLEDAVFKEGNLPTGHTFTSRTALPTVYFRKFNEGVPTSKSRTAQVTEAAGMLEANSKVDIDLAKLNGNEAAFRMSEERAFLGSMNNSFESSFFYSNSKTSPEAPMGVLPRLESTTGPAGSQIVSSGISASGNDQSSVVLVGWGDNTVYGFTPKGLPGGLTARDLGQLLVKDDGGVNEFLAYVTNWNWKFGWGVEDYRYLVRMQIDTSAVSATNDLILTGMIDMVEQLQDLKNCKPVFYVNRKISTYLAKQARYAVGAGGGLTYENVSGRPMLHFQGIPVKRTDALLNTESPVT